MKVFVRKLLYALACLLLIELITAGYYGETRIMFSVAMMFLCIVMMPTKWVRESKACQEESEEKNEKTEE